jgi:cell division protein FtsB
MHVAPATRRWGTRLGLALAVAIAICYVPAQVLARDPRVPGLRRQVEEHELQIEQVERHNLQMMREIQALRGDLVTMERRARADLGMVYPNELVVRLGDAGDIGDISDTPALSTPPSAGAAPAVRPASSTAPTGATP